MPENAPVQKNPDELGALWLRQTRDGKEMLSGEIAGQDVVCFRNDRATSPSAPYWRVMKGKPRTERQNDQGPTREPRRAAPPVVRSARTMGEPAEPDDF